MALVSSPFNIVGTYGKLVVYKVGDNLYARTKSSLTAKRFQKDPAFAKSREKARAFGEASQLAKAIYATFPQGVKKPGLFGRLTGLIHKRLLEGKSKAALAHELQGLFGIVTVQPRKAGKTAAKVSDKKQPIPSLSQWQVTAAGQLQQVASPDIHYQFLVHKVVTVSSLPDD